MIAPTHRLAVNGAVRWIIVAGLLVSLGCSNAPAPGTEGGFCPNDQNCRPGLKCIDMICVVSVGPDGGAIDLGVRDTGPDLGPDLGVDAGPPDVDPGDVDPGDVDPGDQGPVDAGCNLPFTLTYLRDQILAVGGSGGAECGQAACHGVSAAGAIRLDTPLAELRTALLGPTVDPAAPETQLVVPGNPTMSRLWVIVSQEAPVGNGERMPPGGLLPVCQQQAIFDWIQAGALEN